MRGSFAAFCSLAVGSPRHAPRRWWPDGPRDVRSDGPDLVTRRLVLDNSASTADFLDFPVLVTLDATKIDYSLIADPAKDLRFEDATQAPIAHEIEHWNPAGESIVWIRVPVRRVGHHDVGAHALRTARERRAEPGVYELRWELVHHFTRLSKMR